MQASEEELRQSYKPILERAELAESSCLLLEEERGRVQQALDTQETLVDNLERRVSDERRQGEEQVGALETQLEQEQRNREMEVSSCSQVITDLKQELMTKVHFTGLQGGVFHFSTHSS